MVCQLPYFGKCCFCMPLRKGVLAFGYLNIIFSMYILGICSYAIHYDFDIVLLYRDAPTRAEADMCIAINCVDILFNLLLVYGAHKQNVICLKIFYYYIISTTVALVIVELVTVIALESTYELELTIFFLIEQCINIYLLLLVRSLLHKMDKLGRAYENQLQQMIDGELKDEGSETNPSTVLPIESA
ncbi:unnamed protein product, partial [Brenthis ino]